MRRALVIALPCLVAFALSCAYVSYYLRGGPRIIDATSYFLEAKSLAHGSFSFEAWQPSAAFHGRFLLASPDGTKLSVIFPPGYPALLALGVLLNAPMLIGPLLGALLSLVTYFLGHAATGERKVGLLAAALSALCAALRYHTADTMSHGLAALLTCLALGLALRRDLRWASLGSGLCLGWLVATRPVSAAVAVALSLFMLRRAGPRSWLLVAAGSVPGLLLLLAHQHALTGHWLGSTQLAYYAASDAPPGCFAYGFGQGVGCRFEHGDFVTQFLPNGYGLHAAARNLFVHASLFLVDATNAWPLTLVGAYAVLKHVRSPLGVLGAGVLLQALAYVPFYFDGNYPGGGARFLCEAIPLCQVLVARAALDLRVGAWVLPASLAGFLLQARHGHEQLRDRDGGRPMFEPGVLARAGVTHGLVFVDTDHGFNLGFDPGVRSPRDGLVVARRRKDAHDGLLYEELQGPSTYRYVFDPRGRQLPQVLPDSPGTLAGARLEAEAEWPARLERGGAYPVYFPCASAGAGLRLLPATVARLPAFPGGYPVLEVGWVNTSTAESRVRLSWEGGQSQSLSAVGRGCTSWRIPGPPPRRVPLLKVELVAGEGLLDFMARPSAGAGDSGGAVTR